MNEDVEKYVFEKILDDNVPSSPGDKKRYHMRQLRFKNGDESDSSLESVDLNLSTHVLKNEFQKSDSPKILDEKVNFNNFKGLYNNRDIFLNKRSFDIKSESDDDKKDIEKCSSNPNNKKISQLLTENFEDKRFSLPTCETLAVYSPTNTSSPTSSSPNSPSSTTSHNTFQLSPESSHRNSVFDDLLFEIYNRWHFNSKESFDSDTLTDVTESDAIGSKEKDATSLRLNVPSLNHRNTDQLRELVVQLRYCSNQLSGRLIKHLRCREKQMLGLREKFDIMTAFLHASSHKTREDSRIRFSIEPMPGEEAFVQWKDAMRAVARLRGGVPSNFRKKMWLALADNYLGQHAIDWSKTRKFTFNERSNPDDSKLGLQIVKDLHRTGCSRFSGRDNEQDRAVLKRVLLAYARWNKRVGYCQGFNILAALILGVVDWQEGAALKIMIYLVDKVLPENYFANNLRSLSVDMAVFRDLLRCHLPKLSKHLDILQTQATDSSTGSAYEPPLTNVFTMQWLLTMYATCLSPPTTLRLWDCILLEGSEILLRTGVVIWEKLQSSILGVGNASEFYCLMGVLSSKMMEDDVITAEELIKRIFTIAPYPLTGLPELREKFTYNITPFRAPNRTNNRSHKENVTGKSLQSKSFSRSTMGEEDENEDEDAMEDVNCFGGIFTMQTNVHHKMKEENDRADISKVSPGAYTAHPATNHHPSTHHPSVLSERASLDLEKLRLQYKKVMQRQRKAHLILSAVQEKKMSNDQLRSQNTHLKDFQHHLPLHQPPLNLIPPAINHLLASRDMIASSKKNQTILPITNLIQSRFGLRKKLALKQIDQKLERIDKKMLDKTKKKKKKENLENSMVNEGQLNEKSTTSTSNSSSPFTTSLSPPSTTSSVITSPIKFSKQTTNYPDNLNSASSPLPSSPPSPLPSSQSPPPSSSSSSISLKAGNDDNANDDDDGDTDATYEPSHPWCEALKLDPTSFDHVRFFQDRGVKLHETNQEELPQTSGQTIGEISRNTSRQTSEQTNQLYQNQLVKKSDDNEKDSLNMLNQSSLHGDGADAGVVGNNEVGGIDRWEKEEGGGKENLDEGEVDKDDLDRLIDEIDEEINSSRLDKTHQIQSFIDQSINHHAIIHHDDSKTLSNFGNNCGGYGVGSGGDGGGKNGEGGDNGGNRGESRVALKNERNDFENNNCFMGNNNNNCFYKFKSFNTLTSKTSLSKEENINKINNKNKNNNNNNKLDTNNNNKQNKKSSDRKQRIITSINNPKLSNIVERSVVGVCLNKARNTDGRLVGGSVVGSGVVGGGVRDGGLNRSSVGFNPFPRSVDALRRKSQVGVSLGLYEDTKIGDGRKGSISRKSSLTKQPTNHFTNNSENNHYSFTTIGRIPSNNRGGQQSTETDYSKKRYNACLQRQYLVSIEQRNKIPTFQS